MEHFDACRCGREEAVGSACSLQAMNPCVKGMSDQVSGLCALDLTTWEESQVRSVMWWAELTEGVPYLLSSKMFEESVELIY